MEQKIAEFITDLVLYSGILPALVGLFNTRQLRNNQKAILLLVLLSIATEVAVYWIAYNSGLHNIVFYLFTIAEFTLLAYVFTQNWERNDKTKVAWIAIIFFTLFVLLDMLYLSGIEQFNSYSTSVEALLLIGFALSFFYITLRELKIKYLEREPLFWISTGVLLYFASSLFIFLFTNTVNASMEALFIIWGIHGIFRILLNIFYSIALWIRVPG
ncbi:MAG: hypothetical protein AAF798_10620 [Bacteroidota bacterium]